MENVNEYLKSSQMSKELTQIVESNTPGNLEYANQEMICALLRWHQWFENPAIDRDAVKLRPITKADFDTFCQSVLMILGEKNASEAVIRTKIDKLLLDTVQDMVEPGDDKNQRLATLMTMGACEYHGFNGYFVDSVKKHGLDSRYQNNPQIEPIYRIFQRVGCPTSMARFKNDQLIYVSPNPHIAYIHAKIAPKWFSYFNEKNTSEYVNQDYQNAHKKLFDFPGHEKLTNEETLRISTFFDQWWKRLAQPDSRKIAVMPMFRDKKTLQEKINMNALYIEKFGLEKLYHGSMYHKYENVYAQPIKPELIQIIDLPSIGLHQQKLSQLQPNFPATDLRVNHETVKTADVLTAV